MLVRRLLIAMLVLATAGSAYGESKVLVLAPRIIDNQATFGRGAFTKTKITIPRWANGSSAPAGQLIGFGPRSVIVADPSVTGALIELSYSTRWPGLARWT